MVISYLVKRDKGRNFTCLITGLTGYFCQFGIRNVEAVFPVFSARFFGRYLIIALNNFLNRYLGTRTEPDLGLVINWMLADKVFGSFHLLDLGDDN
jgi:hypothetical protein